MATVQELQRLAQGIKPIVPIPETRFTASKMDLPYLPPPYSSMIDDALMDNRIHEYKNKLQQIALHSVKLHAGQINMLNGELGRPAARHPILVPEMLGGRIHTTNV